MKSLTATLALISLITLTAPAGAEPIKLEISGSAGSGTVAVSDCPDSFSIPSCPDPERHRVNATSPLVAIGITATRPTATALTLRYGGELNGSLTAGGGVRAGAAGLIGKIGLGLGRVYADIGAGFAAMHLRDRDFRKTQGTMSFHGSLGVKLTDSVALTARGDAHAVMHSEMIALFGGFGLSWTP